MILSAVTGGIREPEVTNPKPHARPARPSERAPDRPASAPPRRHHPPPHARRSALPPRLCPQLRQAREASRELRNPLGASPFLRSEARRGTVRAQQRRGDVSQRDNASRESPP